MFTYLLINICTILFPISRSFEPKIYFFGKWKALFAAIFISGVFFILWDHLFTLSHVWRFNPHFIMGFYIYSLPIEEWLFFITVPFACIFIYEVLHYFIPTDPIKKYAGYLTIVLIFLFLLLAFYNIGKLYTVTCFLFGALILSIHWWLFTNKYLGMFYLTYLVQLVPFLIVNGLLTWLPVVIYNNGENLGIRIFTIPIEDSAYGFILLLMNISFYEIFKKMLNISHKQ